MELAPDLEAALRRSKAPMFLPAGAPCAVTAFTLRGGRLADVTVGFDVVGARGSITTVGKDVLWTTSPRAGTPLEPVEVQLERAKETARGMLMPDVDLAAAQWCRLPAYRFGSTVDHRNG